MLAAAISGNEKGADIHQAEKNLWYAVLRQAIEDIYRSKLKSRGREYWEREHDRRKAIEWMFLNVFCSQSFLWVCSALGWSPEAVRRAVFDNPEEVKARLQQRRRHDRS